MANKIINFFESKFPSYGEKNVLLFYAITVFGNAWFQIANWLIFILLYIGEKEFSVYEAVAFGIGIMLEIPSGAIADMLGRKRTIIFALSLQALGAFMFVFSGLGSEVIFIANIIVIVSFAFRSGSLEALVYDSLKQSGKKEHYDDVIGKAHSLDSAATIVAGVVGGLAWTFSIYAPWVMSAIAFVFAAIVSLRLVEPQIDTEKFSFASFIKQNKRGFHYLFKSDFRKYTFSLAVLAGSYLMWSVGIVRVLMGRDFGYDGQTLSYLISASVLVGFLPSYYFKKVRKKFGDKSGFGLMLLFASIGWIVAGLFVDSLLAGVFVFAVLSTTGLLSHVWSSVILNEHVHSKDRATAISTLEFLIQLPYVVVVILYGTLVAGGDTAVFYFVIGGILLVGIPLFYRAERAGVDVG